MRTFKRSLALVLAIAMVLTTFGMTVVSAAQYNDTEGHWAESYINTWSGYGVIQGDGGYFRPDDAITRAEVAQVTDNVISYEKIADNMFTDVSTTDWFADAVLKLVAAGTLTGNGDGTMTPNNYMTREEAMTMLARAYGLTVENSQAGITQYADYQNISDYATGYVGAMTAAGYVGGYEDGTIRPKDYISRAEFVKIIDNMIKLYITEPGSYGPEYVGGIVMIKTGGVTLNGIVAGGVVVSPQVSGDVTITGSQVSGDIVNLSEKANVTSNTGNVTNPSATTKPNNIVIGGGGSGGGGNGSGTASLTVKFHYGENYGTVKTKSVTKGKKLSESSVPTPTESNWDGLWYTSKSAAEKCSGTTFDPTISAVNKNYDLYAGHISNSDLTNIEIAVDNKTDYVNVYVGDTLTATNLAPADAKNYVSYQWYRTSESHGTGEKISGATKSSYTATDADKGMYLKVVVTGDGDKYNGTIYDISSMVLAKDAPSIYPEKTTAAFGNDAATTVTLTEGQTIAGVKTESGEMLTADQYTFDAETGKLTISKDYLAGLTDGQNVFTIVVSDDAAYNVTFVVTTTGGPTEGPVPTEDPEPTATVAPGEPTATVAPGEPTATAKPEEPTPTAKPEEPTPTVKPTNKYTATVNVTGGKAVLKDANGNAYPVVEVSNPTEAPATEEPGEPTEAPATEAPAIELTEITESYTFIADNFNSEGTAVIEAGTLLDNGKVYSPNGNTASLKKKKSTINGTEYNNSMRLKGSQNSLVFKAGMDAVVTVYGETHASRVLAAGTTNGGIELGKGVLASGLLTFNVSAGTTVYLTAVNDSDNTAGDVFMAGFTVEPAANAAAANETVQYIIPEGDVVTVDATPDTAGLSAVVTVKGADGQSVAVSNNKFTMPGQNVTADVTFSETPATPEPTATVTPEPTATVAPATPEPTATATAVPATPDPTATATAIPPVNKYVATVNVTGGKASLKDANGNVYPIVESEETPAPATEAPATEKPAEQLSEITESYTFIADNFNSAGNTPIEAGTMLDNGKVFSSGGNTVSLKKGKSTINETEYNNSLRLKGAQNSLEFKTAIDATVTVYGNSHESRVFAAGTTNGGVELGKGELGNGVFTFNVSAGTTVYLTAVNDADNAGGDLFIAGFTVEPTASVASEGSAVQYLIPEGDIVTVDATPDTADLYPIVTVKGADGQDIAVSNSKFTMPGQNVTADVTFGEAPATPEPTATVTPAPPTATPVFPSYANWNIGQAKIDTTDGAAAEVVYPAEGGKSAIEVTSRNIYTTLDQEVSAGQANVSLDVYINPTVPKNFRIYLESGTENYQNPNGEYVFAEVANNNNSSVNYGPNPAEENKLFDYSQMTAGWYKFNITLDYEGTDFITLEVTAPDGTVAGTAKMGAIAGKSTALRQVRLIQTAAAAQFADMAITVSGQPTATPVPEPNKYVATVNVTGGTAVLKDAEGNVYPTYAPEATVAPTEEPTAEPSDAPTAEPSDAPTDEPAATATTAPVTPVTYKYTSTSEIKGGNLCEGGTCTFVDGASDEIRALFADSNDLTKIASELTANYKNYVGGTDGKASHPYIEGINLDAGTYDVYYLGYDNENNIKAIIGDISFSIPAASGVALARRDDNQSRVLKVYKLTFTTETALTNATLTFDTDGQWLPDIYSVILTNTTVSANAAGADGAVQYLIPEGDVVTVDAVAETAGQVASVVVKGADGQDITVENSKFTMPGQDVTADVTFADAPATETPAPSATTAPTAKPAEIITAENATIQNGGRLATAPPTNPTEAYTEEYSNIFGENFSKVGVSKASFLGVNFGGYVTKNYTIDETGAYKAYILVSYAQKNNQFALSKDGTQVVQGTLVDKSEKVGTNGQDLFIYTYDIDNLEAGTYEFKYYSELGQCSDFVAAAIVAVEAPGYSNTCTCNSNT